MDCKKTGKLIKKLRVEKGLTQKELSQKLNVCGGAISKWERGAGFPDIETLSDIERELGVGVKSFIEGELGERTAINGNMKYCKLFYCPFCGNLIVTAADADIACCGRKLISKNALKVDKSHMLSVEAVEDEWYITASHEMTKEHFLSAIVMVTSDKVDIRKLYPEQTLELRFKRCGHGKFYIVCNKDGIFEQVF